MKALGRTHIDLLSLDVEGAELGVLQTIPFSKLIINILLVEYKVYRSKTAWSQRFKEFRRFMNATGIYEFVGTTFLDMVYVRKDIIHLNNPKKWKGGR